jgi:hypothetical protein
MNWISGFSADSPLNLTIRRKGSTHKVKLVRDEGSFLDVDICEKPINTCKKPVYLLFYRSDASGF